MCKAHGVVGTTDQAIWTFDQKLFWLGNLQLKSREAKSGSRIKKYERAIILLHAKNRQRERMNTSPT